MEYKITSANFETEVLKETKPVLLDFWATWCGPCKMIASEVEKIANEVDTVKVGKVNVDEEELLASQYNISVIPTLILIRNGEEVKRISGYMTKDEILEKFGL